jgi:2-keto-3-deoxy-L-rhamnonate aldolase RhmA
LQKRVNVNAPDFINGTHYRAREPYVYNRYFANLNRRRSPRVAGDAGDSRGSIVTKSKVLSKLRNGDFVRVVGINRVTDPWLVEVAGQLGFDVIWFDMEHRPHGYDVISSLSLACRATGMDLMVRVLKTGYTSPMRCLVQRAMDTVANAAAKAGKWWGTVTNTPEAAQAELNRGAGW